MCSSVTYKEVARAAGRVEHAHFAQAAVEGVHGLARLGRPAFGGQQQRGGLGIGPVGAQRLDHRGQHQALDVGARRVVRAELVALLGHQGALQQGAEDGGLDVAPVEARRLQQQGDLVAVQRQHLGIAEQLAVEAQHVLADGHRKRAAVHRLPQLAHQRHELRGVVLEGFQQVDEGAPGQQADVFREHREQRAGQEAGHGLRGVPRGLQRLGDQRQLRGDVAGDAGRAPRRVERERVEPDLAQALADFGPAQVFELEAVRARVGVGRVGGPGAAELGVQLESMADVEHHQERRAPFGGGQGARVLFGLAARAQHGVVEGLARLAQLLGFQHEGAAPVQVEVAGRLLAVAVPEDHPALEHVGVVAGVHAGRLGFGQVERRAKLGDEQAVVGQFAAAGVLPAGDESLQGRVRFAGVGGGGRAHAGSITARAGGSAGARIRAVAAGRKFNFALAKSAPRAAYVSMSSSDPTTRSGRKGPQGGLFALCRPAQDESPTPARISAMPAKWNHCGYSARNTADISTAMAGIRCMVAPARAAPRRVTT